MNMKVNVILLVKMLNVDKKENEFFYLLEPKNKINLF